MTVGAGALDEAVAEVAFGDEERLNAEPIGADIVAEHLIVMLTLLDHLYTLIHEAVNDLCLLTKVLGALEVREERM
jgi:glutamate 5-kinase